MSFLDKELTDWHTHTLKPDALVSIEPGDEILPGYYYSVGVHPWHVGDEDFEQKMSVLEEMARHDQVLAIGETGLDRLRGVDMARQEAALLRHIELSESLGKPLVLHCVRAHEDLIALRKRLKPKQNWMIHGFRGKPAVMHRLVDAGFYLGIGEHANPQTLSEMPADRMLRETD